MALALFGFALATSVFSPVSAQEKDPVVLTVNGQKIRASEISFAKDEILPHLGGLPPKARYPFIVDYLIERHLLAQAAVRDKINKTDAYRKRLRYYQVKALREAYFATALRPKVTEEKIREVYDKEKSSSKVRKRARAQHILVATQKEADEIYAKIKKGGDFSQLARDHSTDEVAAKGGDLGFFFAEEMVPEFSKVVFDLKKNEVGGPIKTKFGWHIVKLLNMQSIGPRKFEDVQEGIQAILLRELVQGEVAQYKKQSKIEYLDPDLIKLRTDVQKRVKEHERLLKEQQEKVKQKN
ncbi:MAG: hypothetical protein GY948_20385 [Alphaproteobacteria bacterium]|nr:hypothetical protein [Alphaproteobacteria bacterium]